MLLAVLRLSNRVFRICSRETGSLTKLLGSQHSTAWYDYKHISIPFQLLTLVNVEMCQLRGTQNPLSLAIDCYYRTIVHFRLIAGLGQ
jgi:hypothetical protein